MQCPTCGNPYTGTPRFCPTCGGPLQQDLQALPAGTVLQQKYRIEQVLGQGGFGITYLALQTNLGSHVAIKELFPAGAVRLGHTLQPPSALSAQGWQQAREDFGTEARMLARFNHPDIVRVLDVFEEGGTVYLVMEHLQGETLQSRILRTGALSPSLVEGLARRLLEALIQVHGAGLLHRDLKPDNIFLEHSGRTVLIDFGSARNYSEGKTTSHTRMVTPGYAPLEQYGSAGRFGPYTDIYALGATLYHALTGEAPPTATDRTLGEALSPLPAGVPANLKKAVLQSLEIRVQDRPQTAAEVLQLLQAAATPLPTPPPVPPPSVPVPLPSPVRPARGFPPAVWVVVFLLAGGWLAYPQLQKNLQTQASSGPGPSADTGTGNPETAADLQQVMLLESNVTLRQAPSLDAPVLLTLQGGDLLPYIQHTAGWYQVTQQGQTGWVEESAVVPFVPAAERQTLLQAIRQGNDVQLQRGVYLLDVPLDVPANLQITGEGMGDTYLISAAPEDVLRGQGISLSLQNLTVMHVGDAFARVVSLAGGSLNLQQVRLAGARRNEETQEFGSGIWLKDGATARIQDSDLSYNAYGLYLSDTSQAEVTGSRFNHNTLGGITFRDQSGGHIVDSTFESNGVHGIHIMGDADPELAGNTIQKNVQRGVSIYDRSTATLQDNRIQQNGYQGIGVQHQAHPVLTGNTIVHNGQSGISFFDGASGVVEGNTIERNARSGIAVTRTANPEVRHNVVSHNGEAGIAFSDDSFGTLQGNTIEGNTNPGVSAWGKARPILLDNTIQNNKQSGVVFAENSRGTLQGNVVQGNALYGMVITDAARPKLIQNRFVNNGKAGVFYKMKSGGEASGNVCLGNPEGAMKAALEKNQPGPNVFNPECEVE